MSEKWSFWEDAVYSLGQGEIPTDRTTVDQAVATIDEWLISSFEKSNERSAGWLFLFAIAGTAAAGSALLGPNTMTLGSAIALAGATAGYWREQLRYRRLVDGIKNGANPPPPFTEVWQGLIKDYIVSLASTTHTFFDASHNPTSFKHEITALDLVWLSSINEGQPLKRALFGGDQYPVTIARPPQPPLIMEKPPSNKTSVFITSIHVDQRQVHVHEAKNSQANRPANSETKPAQKRKKDTVTPWLADVRAKNLPDLFKEFKRHLPEHLEWMAVVIENAAALIKKHPGWSQAEILTELLKQFETLHEWIDLKCKPKRGTIEKMFYRNRVDEKYIWVRRFFTAPNALHKYHKESELSFQFESGAVPGTAAERSGQP